MAKARILAVDDQKQIARMVQISLEQAGFEVDVAYDGQEALDKVAADKPDLVVLDVMMPGMDGWEVLRRLKAKEETASIPVVMLTAKSQDADLARGWEEGCDMYLTKPFNPRELVSVVNRVLEGAET